MENGVHPLPLFAQSIEDRADGIGNAAEKQEQEARDGQYLDHHPAEGDDGPAHADVADHGEDAVLLQIDGCQGGGQSHHGPLEAEEAPGQSRIFGPYSGQDDDGVGAGDEEIDGAVVDDLHDFLAERRLQAVVDAGNGEHSDHRCAVNGGGDDAVDIAVEGGPDDAQGQGHDADGAADDVGDHVHDLLAPGVVRQGPVR